MVQEQPVAAKQKAADVLVTKWEILICAVVLLSLK